jgi:hypothetical protein
MENFLRGFCDELTKTADVDGMPGVGKQIKELLGTPSGSRAKRQALRLGGNAAAIAALHKMINPDVSLGSAIGSGLAITGGGSAGQAVGRHMGVGSRGKAGLSVLGSVVAARALRNRQKRKTKDKAEARRQAREDLMMDHIARGRGK